MPPHVKYVAIHQQSDYFPEITKLGIYTISNKLMEMSSRLQRKLSN